MQQSLAALVLEKLKSYGRKIAVAESLTGGLLASQLTDESGASEAFLGGVVAYNNRAKESLLGVSAELLLAHGAVSTAAALEMALGVQRSFADACSLSLEEVVSLSTTGVAGPAKADGHEVGTVFIAARVGAKQVVEQFHFDGNRQQVRAASCNAALELLLQNI